jgi:hypothetical protein
MVRDDRKDAEAQHARNKATAWVIALIAIAFYVGFILWNGIRSGMLG